MTYFFKLLGFLVLALPAVAEDYAAPRMPWGDPDLQGVWTHAYLTALERQALFPSLTISEDQARNVERMGADLLANIDKLPEGDLVKGDVGGYNSVWMDPGKKMLRIDGKARTSLIIEPENGRLPYTAEGGKKSREVYMKARARNNPEQLMLGDRCMVGFGSTGGPPMLGVLYNNNYQFVQTPGYVMILVEMNHSVRTIRLKGERLPADIKPWLGDSVGHWEGDTLVVETTQFHPQKLFRAAIAHRFMSTTDTKVVERFTRTGAAAIHYEYTVEDASIYSQPWSAETVFRPSEGPIYEYACHEGNYSLPGILGGQREKERIEKSEG
ncbi:hypothetical protein GP2143_18126 [marine gamma proteobacterium HTCC2143]|uniref:Uncharacterized protein n=1 Tax=marine gamma proteobacterium HTCC2143 TaxID=247633 RepID=A0YAP5_9GAMM|nr:hypothetical protein GP2143_18126 [marine gamma proteobacterium HTCC2143]